MSTPLFAQLAYQRTQTAEAVRRAAPALGLFVSETDLARGAVDVGRSNILLFEQRDTPDAFIPRVYSLVGANPDLLTVVIVPHPRAAVANGLLAAGAVDVVDDGPDMDVQLARSLAYVRRLLALQQERSRLSSDLAHQEKLTALGLLSAGVSHEINNPCGAILANMTALREQLEAVLARPRFQRTEALENHAPDWLEAMGDCIGAAKRIHSIVKTLNVFSRRGDGAAPVATDVNEEISTVLRLIGKEVRFQAHFEVALDPELPPILAPVNGVTQILTNLVVNALQALEQTPPGERRIWISTRFDESHVMVEVADNGPGIPADTIGRIFDPFFTTKPVGKGTGLGLSITRELVQKSRGEIFVESAPGEGARFRLVFERMEELREARSERASMPPMSARLRVLLVDDDELTLRSIQRSLSSHFECLALSSGAAALEALHRDDTIDVVVSDIVMPEMSGHDFYERVLLEKPLLAERMAFLTGGVTSDALRARVVASGRPCLAKPVDFDALIQTIQALGSGSR